MRGRRGPGRGVQRRAGHEMACVAARMFSGPGGGAGRPDWTATEALSAAWLLPKDLASVSLRRLLFLLRCRSLLLLSAPSIALQFLLSFPSCVSRSVPLFISLPSCSSPGPLQTLSSGLSWGWVAAAGGGTRRLSGTKALRCGGPPRVAAFEKKPDGVLMQRVSARTERTGSFIRVLKLRPVWTKKKGGRKKAHHPPGALPSVFHQAH